MSNRTNRITTAKNGAVARNALTCIGFVLLLFSLGACGGSKVLKESEPLTVTQSLANAEDQHLSVTLDWVIYRDGPGTWARNADWDEYLIRVQNSGGEPLQITSITVVDLLGTPVAPGMTRRSLVKGSKNTVKRYRGWGLEVKAGLGAGPLMVAGAVTATAGYSVAAASAGSTMSGVAAGAAGAFLVAPAIAVGGVMRGLNNSKVNDQIEVRQTLLPVQLASETEQPLHIFYPLAPSPTQIEVSYVDGSGEHSLIVDTREPLNGLHIVRNN